MELRFATIINKVSILRNDKYTQREINLKVLWVLLATDWKVYKVALQKKVGFSEMSTDKLFLGFKADEHDIRRTKESYKAGASEEQA